MHEIMQMFNHVSQLQRHI